MLIVYLNECLFLDILIEFGCIEVSKNGIVCIVWSFVRVFGINFWKGKRCKELEGEWFFRFWFIYIVYIKFYEIFFNVVFYYKFLLDVVEVLVFINYFVSYMLYMLNNMWYNVGVVWF